MAHTSFNSLVVAFILAWATPAWGVTYWVATTGNDSNACSAVDGSSDPGTYKLTIDGASGGLSCLSAGDTAMIKAGTYNEGTITDPLLSGTSASARTTMRGDSAGTRPILRPTTGTSVISLQNSREFIAFEYMELDASSQSSPTDVFRTSNGDDINSLLINDNVIHSTSNTMSGTAACITVSNLIHDSTISNNDIHNCKSSSANPGAHGIYMRGDNNVIENNILRDVNGWCWQNFYSKGTSESNIYRYNYCHDSGEDTNNGGALITSAGTSTILVHHNIFVGRAAGGTCAASHRGVKLYTGARVYNNTITCWSIGVNIKSTDVIVRNNVIYNNTTTIDDDSAGATADNNLTSDPSFTDAPNDDYTLLTGSTAINNGSTAPGFSYNGSAPDQGAFETFAHSSCEVGNVDTTSLIITFENNLYPPLLPSSSVTTFTARENSSAATVSSCARSGNNSIDCTLSAAITGGTTVDYSWASGNLTDSADLGGVSTYNQPFLAVTNQSCTNNVSGGSGEVLTQTRGRFRLSHGAEASTGAPFGDAAEDANWTVSQGGLRRVRLKMACTTADCASVGIELRYAEDGGAYTALTDTCGNICFYGTGDTTLGVTDGVATTEQLTSGHATNVACEVKRQSGSVPNVDLSQNSESECEYVIQIGSSTAVDTTYDFRLYKDGGTALDAYDVTPRLTVRSLRGSR